MNAIFPLPVTPENTAAGAIVKQGVIPGTGIAATVIITNPSDADLIVSTVEGGTPIYARANSITTARWLSSTLTSYVVTPQDQATASETGSIEFTDDILPPGVSWITEPSTTITGPVTASITGPVTVTPEAGSVFDVGTISGTVVVTPEAGSTFDVGTVTGTVTVTPEAGSTFDANITNATITVVPSGGSFDVSITNATLTVEPSGGNFDVSLTASSVTLDANATIQNFLVNSDCVVATSTVAMTINNLVQGGTATTEVDFAQPTQLTGNVTLADGMALLVCSVNGYVYELQDAVLFMRYNDGLGGDTHYGGSENFVQNPPASAQWNFSPPGNKPSRGIFGPFWNTPTLANMTAMTLLNNTGSTIVSDTVYLTVVFMRMLDEHPSDFALQTEPGQGQFGSIVGTNGGSVSNWNPSTSQTVITSGGYLTKLTPTSITASATVQNESGVTAGSMSVSVTVYIGSQVVAQASGSATIAAGTEGTATATITFAQPLTFDPGVSNGGVVIDASYSTGPNGGAGYSFASSELSWGAFYGVQVGSIPPSLVGVVT